MRHLIGIEDLSVAEIEQLIATAEDIMANPAKYSAIASGKKLATLFYEPSTRTRLSFEAAMMELGGGVLGFSEAQSSSAAKGESVADTAKVISCFADIMVMRHFKEGAPMVAAMLFRENFVVGCFLEVFSDSSSLPRKRFYCICKDLTNGSHFLFTINF